VGAEEDIWFKEGRGKRGVAKNKQLDLQDP